MPESVGLDFFFLIFPFTEFVWFSLVSLFHGISTFVGYLMPNPFSLKNSSGTI